MQRAFTQLVVALPFFVASFLLHSQETEVFNIWYGDNQTFGNAGTVQRYVNILGNLDRQREFTDLNFSLNNSSFQFLTIGSDYRRLWRKGDFNVEMPIDNLLVGKNSVVLQAVDSTGSVFSKNIEVIWNPQTSIPNKMIKWDEVSNLNEVAQPIDGLWRIEDNMVVSAPEEVGYDRVLGIGDISWTDYEVLFPFEIRDLDPSAYDSPHSINPAILFISNWLGHTDSPRRCPQPHCGWEPYGSITGYSWPENNVGKISLSTRWNSKSTIKVEELTIEIGEKYWFRGRSEITNAGNFYSIKVWKGSLNNEPKDWLAKSLAGPLNVSSGSFLLVAHHIDLAVGNMEFIPLASLHPFIKQVLVNYTPILVQLPYIFIWAVGILWAIVFINRDSQRGQRILISFGLMFMSSLIGLILQNTLPDFLQKRSWGSLQLNYIYIFIHAIPIAGHLVAWLILFKTLLPSNKES